MAVLTTIPKMLYPHSRQFPFDEVAENIVKALEKRNWNVPGIAVEFYNYGSGEAKYKMVDSITGDYFKLHFCRYQGHLDSLRNDIAALHSVCIPKQILKVYSDESGPTYYLYVGNDWDADKDWFMNSIKIGARERKEPRRYLKYSGNTYKKRTFELFAYNDIGREYSPEGDEPVRLNLNEKFKEIIAWLEQNVLKYILSFPEDETILPPKIEELIPYTGPWSTIFTLCEWHEASRIALGKNDPTDLPPEKRHAYIGSGNRLVPLDVRCNGRFPKIATEGFIWCDPNQSINKKSKADELLEPIQIHASTFWGSRYLVAINLKYSNEVYVADNSKFNEIRMKLFEEIAPRDRLTNEEVGQAYAARGATIVPITEYKGGYKEPLVLINRELEFFEIQWLQKLEE